MNTRNSNLKLALNGEVIVYKSQEETRRISKASAIISLARNEEFCAELIERVQNSALPEAFLNLELLKKLTSDICDAESDFNE